MDSWIHAKAQPGAGRSARHLLVGALLSPLAAGLLATLVILWGTALFSLLTGPEGGWGLIVLYVVTVLALPIVTAWFVHEIGVLQRSRFRHLLGVDIAEPSWTLRSTARQAAYHMWALAVALPAVVLFVAPPAARWLARRDSAVAEDMLGPTRIEVLNRRLESLRSSRAEVLLAADEERRRIERDLHDGAQQRLMSLALNLGMAREAITEPSPAREAIVAAHEEAMLALTELRHFVRGLHPAVLEDRGLDAAISGIAARSPIPVEVSVDIGRRCPGTIEAIAYFIVSEALTNVTRHASATQASVDVRRHGGRLAVTVRDDGRGGATTRPGGGLAGLAQRAAAVDGELSLDSPAGGPTIVEAVLPCG
ncbi:sensor histidine kinase [Amorphoplanes digitatis]|uniref:histidine kinase n=1 Tax=Actinoplanes digitatis TaxID=1868 RepID=A0A7W7HTR2_9ACTN|nr:histidine kinase [Actinoplanes digitatis]MBB4760637.1 signal transduction histidine kinase [Actinoplanes digitatis]